MGFVGPGTAQCPGDCRAGSVGACFVCRNANASPFSTGVGQKSQGLVCSDANIGTFGSILGSPAAKWYLYAVFLSDAARTMNQPQLTRRRDNDPHRTGWFVYFGDVLVGHIGTRTGVPNHAPQWGWRCGFYPGCDPQHATGGVAESFEEARAGFEQAWNRLSATRTEAHYELWRQSRDFHAWKGRMQAARLPLPSQRTSGRSHCFCGEELTVAGVPDHVQTKHRGLGNETDRGPPLREA